MEYRQAKKKLEEIIVLLNEQVIDKHEYIIDLIREQDKRESGAMLAMRMESSQEHLLHLKRRVEELLCKVEKAERRGIE